jgi:hypothetical protein
VLLTARQTPSALVGHSDEADAHTCPDIECCIKLIKQARFSRFYQKNSDIPKNSKCSINHIPLSLIESIQGECIDNINITLNELIIILIVLIVKKKR